MSALAYLVIFVLAAVGGAAVVVLLRPKRAATGQPTAAEAKIISIADKQREELKETTPSGAEAQRMSDAELERSINDRSGK